METIIGRLTRDAAVKTLDNGKTVVNFDIADTETFTVKATGEKKEDTRYTQCAYWVNTTVAKYLTKGTLVEVAGRMGVNAYTNKDGNAVGVLRLNVRNIKFHGGGTRNDATAPQAAVPAKAATPAADITEPVDDLPF